MSRRLRKYVDVVTLFGSEHSGLKPKQLQNIGDSIKTLFTILPMFRTFGKYGHMTIRELAEKFSDPFLREAVKFFIDAPGWPMKDFPIVALSGLVRSAVLEAGVPLGGSHKVIQHLADQLTQSGGEILYNKRVSGLIIESDEVRGVELQDGSRHEADEVIWAGDGHTLIYDILDGRYVDEMISTMYRDWIPVKPLVHVALGVDRDMSEEPHRRLHHRATRQAMAWFRR